MFKTMTSVTDKNMPKTEDIEKISSFVFCRWLENNPGTIHAANKLNLYYNIPMMNQYLVIKSMLAGKNVFIKYPKQYKSDLKEDEILAKHFKIRLSLVYEYRKFSTKQEIDSILTDYKNLDKGLS